MRTSRAPVRSTAVLAMVLGTAVASAQGLPPPSRTVYKCEEGGKVRYSDSPCLGATKLEVQPTRGLDSSSGRAQQGQDVRNERIRESVAEAIKPLTGMSAEQVDRFGRRQRLSPEAQRQCRSLDRQLPSAETAETAASGTPQGAKVQQRLLELRTAYRKLGCE